MNRLKLLMFCVLFSSFVSAQQMRWVRQQGGSNPDQTNGIVADASGNVIAVGTFDGTASFGNGISLTTTGSLDIFVAKYDSAGTCLWAKKAGGAFGDEGRGVSIDASGNIYVTGIYGQAGAAFDAINVGTTGGLRNGFIAKYSAAGDVQWVKRIGGVSSGPEPKKIVVASATEIYLAGDFGGTIDFEGQHAISSMQPGGWNDVFLAKYDETGAALWANRAGDRKLEKLSGLAVDNSGNPIIYGTFDSLTTIQGTTKYAEYFLTGGNMHYDLFLAKYSASGGSMWVRTFGGGVEDASGGVCVDAADNIYTSGYFGRDFKSGTIDFFGNSGFNLFVHKLSSTGTPVWLKSVNPSLTGYKYGAELLCTGNEILMAGYFGTTFTVNNATLTGSGENNPMLIVYDTSGVAKWGMSGSGVTGKVSQGLSCAAGGGRYYYAGYINGAVTFSGTTATAPGVYTDGFISAVAGAVINPPVVADPSAVGIASATTTSLNLTWNGSSPEFRVLKKINSSSTSPTDGDLVYEGAAKTFSLGGLTANTAYFITVYGKATGSAAYSAGSKKIAATTVSADPDSNVVIGFLAGETGERAFGGTGVKIRIETPSGSDGNIQVELNTNLTATGTLPVNIDSVFDDIYWKVTATGLTGSSLRYCITLDVSDVWGLMDFVKYHILKRPVTGAPWEDLMANASYTVTRNSPEITICGLSSFSEFAVGMESLTTGIGETSGPHIGMYPNPASAFVYADVSGVSATALQLIDVQGRVVRTVPVTEGSRIIRIERASLPPGLYLVRAGAATNKIWFID